MKEKLTIVIADDNHEFSMTLASYLEKQEDMEVISICKDGNEAVEVIANTNPDIAILDVIMPHLDGIGVLESVNMLKLAKKPICIMLSAVGQDKITQRAKTVGTIFDASKLESCSLRELKISIRISYFFDKSTSLFRSFSFAFIAFTNFSSFLVSFFSIFLSCNRSF